MIPNSVDLRIARLGGAYADHVGKAGVLALVAVLLLAVLYQAVRDV